MVAVSALAYPADPQTQEARPTEDPRWCPGCGSLAKQASDFEFCADCDAMLDEVMSEPATQESKEAVERYALSVLRPKSVVAVVEGKTWTRRDTAALVIPRSTTPRDRLVAEEVAEITTERLAAGWSWAYCFRQAALGGKMIVKRLAAKGISMDPKTVRAALLVILKRVGQLDDWIDLNEPDIKKVNKTGAYTYRLNVRIRELSADGLDHLISIDSVLGGTGAVRKVKAWLRGVLEHAKPGNRHWGGLILAHRCRDAGLTEGEARDWMRSYAAQVTQQGHPYTLREAMATARSVYKRIGL